MCRRGMGFEGVANVQKGMGYEAASIATTSDATTLSVPQPSTTVIVNEVVAGNEVATLGPQVVGDNNKAANLLGLMEPFGQSLIEFL